MHRVDETHRWLSFAQIDADAVGRANSWVQHLDDLVREIVVAPNDVDKVLKAAGTRDIQALAAMSHWAFHQDFDARTGERIARYAHALFKQEFASFMQRGRDDNLYDAAQSEWAVNPLTEALVNVGLSVEDFTEAYQGLACDAFSRMTRCEAWLRDRPRSIILLVIAGCVALRRSDTGLLKAVRDAARHAQSQPPSNSPTLNASRLAPIEQRLGFTIPAA